MKIDFKVFACRMITAFLYSDALLLTFLESLKIPLNDWIHSVKLRKKLIKSILYIFEQIYELITSGSDLCEVEYLSDHVIKILSFFCFCFCFLFHCFL